MIFVVAGFVDNQSIRLIILMLGASLTFALILLLSPAEWAGWALWVQAYWYLAMLVPIALLVGAIVSANKKK
ncbi:hypothetical protein D3C87_1681960 [compost metagenome]